MKVRLLALLGGRPETDASGARKTLAPPQKKQAPVKRYQSVSITYPNKCCPAVKALAGQRFLAGSAPSLPLPACSLSDQCRCSFQKHADRRDYDRRLPGEKSRWYGGAEKRRSRDRRGTD